MKILCALIVFGLLPLRAQDVKFPESFEKLAAKAKETVNINLDGSLLRLAGNFLSGRNADEAGDLLRRCTGAAAARVSLEAVWQYWNHTLGAVQVATPDAARRRCSGSCRPAPARPS